MARISREIITRGEEGHGPLLVGPLIAGVGAIVLGIGAANDTGALAVIGGIVMAVGLVAGTIVGHMMVEWGVLARIDKLEK